MRALRQRLADYIRPEAEPKRIPTPSKPVPVAACSTTAKTDGVVNVASGWRHVTQYVLPPHEEINYAMFEQLAPNEDWFMALLLSYKYEGSRNRILKAKDDLGEINRLPDSDDSIRQLKANVRVNLMFAAECEKQFAMQCVSRESLPSQKLTAESIKTAQDLAKRLEEIDRDIKENLRARD